MKLHLRHILRTTESTVSLLVILIGSAGYAKSNALSVCIMNQYAIVIHKPDKDFNSCEGTQTHCSAESGGVEFFLMGNESKLEMHTPSGDIKVPLIKKESGEFEGYVEHRSSKFIVTYDPHGGWYTSAVSGFRENRVSDGQCIKIP